MPGYLIKMFTHLKFCHTASSVSKLVISVQFKNKLLQRLNGINYNIDRFMSMLFSKKHNMRR